MQYMVNEEKAEEDEKRVRMRRREKLRNLIVEIIAFLSPFFL